MNMVDETKKRQRRLTIAAFSVWLVVSLIEVIFEPEDLVTIGMWEVIIAYSLGTTIINLRHASRYRRLLRTAPDVQEDEIILARGYVRKERYRLLVAVFMAAAGLVAIWVPILTVPLLFDIPIFVSANSTGERMDRVALLGPKVREESG